MTSLSLSELLILSLAVWHAVEVWHHGSLFHDWRAWLENRPCGDFVTDLMLCPFCLSLWVAGFLVTLGQLVPGGYGWWPVYALAVARISNLLNDLGRPWCRTPNRKRDDAD